MTSLFPLLLAVLCGPTTPEPIKGQYLEARTCDVWTGPCFANAEMNWGGKNAVLAWKVDQGSVRDIRLDGLCVVAIISASDTLGLEQTGPSKAVLIVDRRANAGQREALVELAKRQAGGLAGKVISVESAKVDFQISKCDEGGCGFLDAGKARVETRCLDHHDKVCGNETAFYPPLAKDVSAKAAVAVEHSYTGAGLGKTWTESGRRGAYIGSFTTP
jgi:hypothetical protein